MYSALNRVCEIGDDKGRRKGGLVKYTLFAIKDFLPRLF